MCGHIGVAGNLGFKEEKILKQGLVVDSLRGDHSTGVAVVPKGDADPSIVKQVGNAYELLFDKRFDDVLKFQNRVLIGHNRYATSGNINKQNAHPFNFGDIYGAHNGTLSNWSSLDGWKDFSVDSKRLYHHMAQNTVEDTIGKITGAWALVWWNHATSELNFLRNSERTFYYVMDEEKKLLFWSSEWEMLQLILNRNGVKYGKISVLPENQWMRWPIDKEGVIGKPTTKKVEGKKPYVHIAQHTNTGGKVTNNNSTTKTYTFDSKVTRLNAVLEVFDRKMDCRRASYLALNDAENPQANIRLYIHKGDEFKWKKGALLVCHVSGFTTEEGGYYKVTYSTVRGADANEQMKYDAALLKKEIDSKTIETYPDHKGVFLSKKEWEEKYPYCAWCCADLRAEDLNHITKDGDALCPDCSANEDVKAYL